MTDQLDDWGGQIVGPANQIVADGSRANVVSSGEKDDFGGDIVGVQANPNAGLPEDSALQRALNQKAPVDFPTFAMATPAFRFIEGAADLPLGTAQFVSESLGFDGVTKFLRNREERIARGREAVGSEGFDLPRLAGNISTAMAATGRLPVSNSVTGRIGQGAGLGAVMGASTPSTSENIEQEKKNQIIGGAVIGGIVPGAIDLGRSVVRAGRNLISPLLPRGADRTVRDIVLETTDNIDETVSALRSARPGENVGQATARTGNTRLAAFQRAGDRANPDAAAATQSAQNASRLERLRQTGGAQAGQSLDDAAEAARNVRRQRTNPLFEAAKSSDANVDAGRTLGLVDDLIASDPRNAKLTSALKQIRDSISDGDKAASSPRELISAWRNMQNLMDEKGPTGQRVNDAIIRQLTIVRRSLEGDISRSVPEFREANRLFKELSVPVNRAQVASGLESRLASNLSGSDDSVINQQAAQFSGALSNERKLIKDATGFARGRLDKIFSPDEISTLKGISQELKNNAEFNRLAQMGNSEARQILGTLGPEPLANPLMRVIMVVNALIKKSGRLQTGQALKRMGEVFQNPDELADILESATTRERGIIKSALAQIPVDQLARTAPAVTVNQ